jgi:hypothetical protein
LAAAIGAATVVASLTTIPAIGSVDRSRSFSGVVHTKAAGRGSRLLHEVEPGKLTGSRGDFLPKHLHFGEGDRR